MKSPRTLEELMAVALAMENEAVERYSEFADALATHNNPEVAAMFAKMAGYEAKHAEQIRKQMGWTADPKVPRELVSWPGYNAPESAPTDAVHYLMQPWHALTLALAAEERAEAFFAQLVAVSSDEAVRAAAEHLRAEEAEHVALIREWMTKVPQPDNDWSDDPDPPRMVE
jgi:rubrerythrin